MIGWAGAALAAAAAAAWVLSERRRPEMDAKLRRTAPGLFADLPSGRTHYMWHGPADGQVCVCIHGLTTPSFVWDALVPHLTRTGLRVLTYDLYGRGYSDRPGGRQDRAFFLRQLEELLAHEGVGDALVLMGYSMGGSIATAFAAAHPRRVDRLVLIAPAGLGHVAGRSGDLVTRAPVLGDWLMRVFGGRNLRADIAATRVEPSQVPGLHDRQEAETRIRGYLPAVLSSMRHMLAEDLRDDHRALAATDIAVLAVWGREDGVIPIAALGRLAEINRAARQEVVEGAGHGLPHTHPEPVAAALRGFLREL